MVRTGAAPAPAAKVAKPAGKKPAAKPAGKPGGKAAVTLKKVAPGKAAAKKKAVDPRFMARPRNFAPGRDIPPKSDLTRFVRWPRYIWRQRHVQILQKHLKIPPAVFQFTKTLPTSDREELFKLCAKYKPETKKQRALRLKDVATAKAALKGKSKEEKAKFAKAQKAAAKSAKPKTLRCGLKCVTRLIELKRAKLVLIASDVVPLDLVLCLPALCRKQGIPYALIKGKQALGKLVGFKQATCVAFENVRPEDSDILRRISERSNEIASAPYAKGQQMGLIQGKKTRQRLAKQKRRAKPAVKPGLVTAIVA